MLIYDHNKEFIGIDESSLTLLGYTSFNDLLSDHKDVAELFVKKVGYIHNFTNFPWIDFVLHAESDDSKVIIAGKTKSFSATISITTLHLSQAPEETAYAVELNNIQNYQLDAGEQPEVAPSSFTPDISSFVEPEPTPEPLESFEAPAPQTFEAQPQEDLAPLTFDDDVFSDTPAVESTPEPEPAHAQEDDLDIFFGDEEPEPEPEPQEIEIPKKETSVLDSIKEDNDATPMLGAYLTEEEKAYLADLEFDDNYVYNPQIAADELGLPVDLIEEFIGDFINQAHEFKDQLFDAIAKEDFDNIKVLSHKLKGVAANLRIEDSFEVLRNINESNDPNECEANLKKFYLTIAKLEGKDIEEVKQELESPTRDLYDLDIKTPEVTEDTLPEAQEPVEMPGFKEEFFESPEPEPEPSFELPDLTPDVAPEATQTFETESFEEEPLLPPLNETEEGTYDFGLVQSDTNEPLIVLEDEEEVKKELSTFDVADEAEVLADLQDFEEPNEDTLADQPVLTYDVNTAAAEIGLSADLVGALIDDYIVEANEMKDKLLEVLDNSDMIRLKGYAIQLKGVSDNLRINEISDTLQKLISSTDQTQAKAAIQEFYGFINQL